MINKINDLPETIDFTQFKDIESDEILEYLELIYKRFPEVRSDIIKHLMEKALDKEMRSSV